MVRQLLADLYEVDQLVLRDEQKLIRILGKALDQGGIHRHSSGKPPVLRRRRRGYRNVSSFPIPCNISQLSRAELSGD